MAEAESCSGDDVRIYLIAVCSEKYESPVPFRLENAMNKTAYEASSVFLPTLIETENKETHEPSLLVKFFSKDYLIESCMLHLAADDNEIGTNLHLTINQATLKATLTAYESYEGRQVWKSVSVYSVVPISSSHSKSLSLIFGGTGLLKFRGISSCSFYPLEVKLNKDFTEAGLKLGEGGYGTVHKCFRGGMPYAVKRILGQPDETPSCEIEAMLTLSGAEHIVQMYLAWGEQATNGYTKYIMMEIFERSLEDYLSARRDVDLQKSTSIFTEIMIGVQSMHNAGIIHRDLKPMNILVDKNEHVSIADFGTCAIKPYPFAPMGFPGREYLGTDYYRDPVMAIDTRTHAEEVDAYSSGVIYSEMHLVHVSKRRNLVRDIDKKIKYRMKHKTYDFLRSSIWNDWGGNIDIVRLTLLVKAGASRILEELGVSTEKGNNQEALP